MWDSKCAQKLLLVTLTWYQMKWSNKQLYHTFDSNTQDIKCNHLDYKHMGQNIWIHNKKRSIVTAFGIKKSTFYADRTCRELSQLSYGWKVSVNPYTLQQKNVTSLKSPPYQDSDKSTSAHLTKDSDKPNQELFSMFILF